MDISSISDKYNSINIYDFSQKPVNSFVGYILIILLFIIVIMVIKAIVNLLY